MYRSATWYICPIWFIPATFLWVCLDSLFEDHHLDEKLAHIFKVHKNIVRSWRHRILGVLSYTVTLFLIVIISELIGFDLFEWEWIEKES